MPGKKDDKKNKLILHIDILRPQGNPEQLSRAFTRWLLSSGRYIFIFVEAIVLIAFLSRFKLDADIARVKEAIEGKLSFVNNLRPYETAIKQTQLKLSSINSFYKQEPRYSDILDNIAKNTPQGVTILSMSIKKEVDSVTIQINAQARSNNDFLGFFQSLKQDSGFANVNLAGVGLEKGLISFTMNMNTASVGGKSQ